MKIYKYPLEKIGELVIAMPDSAQILTCQMQGNELCLWALVHELNRPEDRTLEVVPTGHTMPFFEGQREYIGTVQMAGGALVYHVFEKVPFVARQRR